MRYRQIHLDFHTSEKIPGIGAEFSAEQFQAMLKLGHVDSITCFSKCHHGWSYHPTEVGKQHPELDFDLLGAQIEAAHAIDVKVPVYISAGLDEQTYWKHPEWARRQADGSVPWAGSNDRAGYHEMCMNTGYLDLLLAEIEEVCQRYDGDGIFLDIVSPRPCWCNTCVSERMADGSSPNDATAIDEQARRVYLTYTRSVRAAIDKHKPGHKVFHNGGHIRQGDRELAHENTHLELESLPTGGWGYDHFPLSAAYARTVGMPFLGMSGKFHFSWGEFGGFKHPNALRYEVAAAAAHGARFSVGDQLHPGGMMEEATYALIGEAYAELETKEPWLEGSTNCADIALLSAEAAGTSEAGIGQMPKNSKVDAGASRILNEGHFVYDVVDREAAFDGYKVLVLPDAIRCDAGLTAKLQAFVTSGGKIVASGTSCLTSDDAFALDFGCTMVGEHPHDPDYIVPKFDLPPWRNTAFLIYGQARDISLSGGEALAHRDPPYFNREIQHFCSHRHTPNSKTDGGPVIVSGPAGSYIAYGVFDIYAKHGQQVIRDMVIYTIKHELGRAVVETSLPAAGRVTLTRQEANKREVLHLLFAQPSKRGDGVEVIEDLVPVFNIAVSVARGAKPSAVTLAPSGEALEFDYTDGRVSFTVPTVECHQMVVLSD
ncbi:MAG: beta-galactosidase trimerization domain-containing protein [Planctomycetota bacterium]|jgi:hypothetical protein|nr:beta-galactosidase trimerization domain-containing protein [Planctomycetota bacterium]